MVVNEYFDILNTVKQAIKGSRFEDKVYSVGGCERDRILGRPIKDIDFAVELQNGGIDLVKFLFEKDYLVGEPVIFERYGTCKFCLKDFPEHDLEAVQTRKEKYTDYNSRNPETAFGELKDDAIRRDLTINAIYRNVSTDEIVDITGGLEDIKNKVIRTTSNPDFVFDDDPLRILRVIRFSTVLGWKISDDVYDSIKKNADRLSIISHERIIDELVKILSSENAKYGFELINRTNCFYRVFQYIYPGVDSEKEKLIKNCIEGSDLVSNLAAVYVNICSSTTAKECMKNMHFGNHVIYVVARIIDNVNYLMDLPEISCVTTRKMMSRFVDKYDQMRAERIALTKLLHEGNTKMYNRIYKYSLSSHKELRDKTWNYNKILPVNGDDIRNTFNVEGRKVGEYLRKASELYYEFPDSDKDTLLNMLSKNE